MPEFAANENLQKSSNTMLARRSIARAAVAHPPALGAAPAGARNMATLREIELRLKSVRNIEKITKVGATSSGEYLYLTVFRAVDENDCVQQTCKGPEGHGGRKELRYCKQGFAIIIYSIYPARS